MVETGVKEACPLGLLPPLGERGGRPRNPTAHVGGRISTEPNFSISSAETDCGKNSGKNFRIFFLGPDISERFSKKF